MDETKRIVGQIFYKDFCSVHSTAMGESVMAQFYTEAKDKEKQGFIKMIEYVWIEGLSPISTVLHKFRDWRAILDLTFVLKWLKGIIPSVNGASTKTAARESID